MSKEIEAKFLQIDVNVIRQKLKDAGAVKKSPMKLMRRVMIKTNQMRLDNSFLRVRDEGNKVTMTYKRFDNQSVDGCEEIEMVIDNFEKAIELLKAAGLTPVTYQESKREIWQLREAEIVIDEWPWVKEYLEIESSSKAKVKSAAKQLGLNWKDAVFGSVMRAYEAEYPIVLESGALISDISLVKFGDKIPDILLKNSSVKS